MAAERDELLEELFGLIISLEEEGQLDTRFMDNYTMKLAHDSTFFLELVVTFCEEVQDALRDLGSALEDRLVCYGEVYDHYKKLKGIIESFGASAMGRNLEELLHSILDTSRRECILAHLRLHRGLENLRPHLRRITRDYLP
ncbi:uncharacterized protein LOC115751281 isoform X2 [Rhodamnia argentea]|uniref:Uncharacterized protein LOC115751281 isoform X2 n=1 Tax=Rhodamnia argentea TaxID=178133 RepID=A0ABM3HEV8_9MYRT|nr:uncharacterized protein LOC115751281 isoform X2 [Rhodamnia argentea]